MSYVLRALITRGSESIERRALVATPLAQGLWLVPVAEELLEEADVDGRPSNGILRLPRAIERLAVEMSSTALVAYVEAEYFGGVGEQRAVVWSDGEVVLERSEVSEEPGVSPISQALQVLGVDRGQMADEFEAAGLGAKRFTGDWLT
jgi:hypothetical protein